METSTAAIRCQAVTKNYTVGDIQVRALRGVDLEVRQGELMMLVGPSGCGKTTLLSVVAGILDQDQGQCEVFGHDLLHMQQKEKLAYRARNIGFVFQAYNLLPTLTAVENVAVPLIINHTPRREALAKAQDMLAKVGLAERNASLPSQLSGGEQQRVAIARSLAHGPRLVVCDEPTSALDHETGQRVMELLRGVALADDRTLLIVTHDARIFEFADRIARMDDGRITRVASPAEEP